MPRSSLLLASAMALIGLDWDPSGEALAQDARLRSDPSASAGDALEGVGGDVGDAGAKDQEEPIVTDRPDFTEASSTVPEGRVQFESGYTFITDERPQSRVNNHVFPELLMRYGLTEKWELRVNWIGYAFSEERDRRTGTRRQEAGSTDLFLGFKRALTEQDGWIPEMAVIGAFTAPVGADAFTFGTPQYGFNHLFSWDLSERVSLAGSLGVFTAQDQGDGFVVMNQSLSVGLSLTEKLGCYAEWFAFTFSGAADSRPEHYFDGGFTYQVTPDFQLDIRAGVGANGKADDFFTGAGFAVRY